ncbi:type II toxin-antitoxin system RelE/ParE family toxin, partial [Xanthomonas maliensis]
MLRREWTEAAAGQLEHAQDHYHALNRPAAAAMARRVLEATRTLGEQPQRGRAGRVPGTREWVVAETPYVLVYRVRGDALQILHVWLKTDDWLPRRDSGIERMERWIAAMVSALVHVLMLLVLLSASTPKMTTPQGSAAGGRVKVDFVGDSASTEPPSPTPTPVPPATQPTPTQPPSATSPVQATVVQQARNPLPPDGSTRSGRVTPPRPT